MCSGAMRSYLDELDALPDSSLVAMVPVGLKAKSSQSASASGGNAVGAVMVKLGTDQADPADRLQGIHHSMVTGKEALGTMTPSQILAMSALGLAPAVLGPMLKLDGITRPPFNLIISNVPGPAGAAVLQRRPHGGDLPAVDPDPRHGPQHHLHVVRRQPGLRAHRLPPHASRACSGCWPTSTTSWPPWRRRPGCQPTARWSA